MNEPGDQSQDAEGMSAAAPEQSEAPLPPKASSYLKVVGAVWVYLAGQCWLLSKLLMQGDEVPQRGLVLFSIFLGLGFLLICAFDFAWLRWGRRG